MENRARFQEVISVILKRTRPRLERSGRLTFRSVFGAVAGYVDGQIFITSGRFGVALKLPARTAKRALSDGTGHPLRYFEAGHVKKGYVVLTIRTLRDDNQMKVFIDSSLRFARH